MSKRTNRLQGMAARADKGQSGELGARVSSVEISAVATPTALRGRVTRARDQALASLSAWRNNMLGLAKRTRACILQALIREVYGDPEVHLQPEEYLGKVNPIGIGSYYDEGKRYGETLFVNYNRQHNLDIKVVRIFNNYGPLMHPNDGRAVSTLLFRPCKAKTSPFMVMVRKPEA